jgi:hypothetical protein
MNTMSEIQYDNKHPDQLAVSRLHPGMDPSILLTPNGNELTVRTTKTGVGIVDWRLLAGTELIQPMYMFAAFIEYLGVLRAIIRSRAPGDWPHRKHPDIRPAEQMQQTIDYLDSINNPVEIFRANWTVNDPLNNTNVSLYRKYVSRLSLHQGLGESSLQEAAISHTPTGKLMERLGFVLDIESVVDHGEVIEVDFMRVAARSDDNNGP